MDVFTEETDVKKRAELNKLMADWENVIKSAPEIVFPDTGALCPAIDYFSRDGFFPGYFSQKTKVLFIGREPRWVSGQDRITSDIEGFKTYNPNGSAYWRRLFYIYYGIKNDGKIPFSQIPYPKEMTAHNDFSFSVMNVSKYSNDTENGATADFTLINRFLTDSRLEERNFIREEIELLEPDVIVAANLWGGKIDEEKLALVFPNEDFSNKKTDNTINCWDFNLNGKTVKIIDSWHFSNWKKIDQEDFYDPIMKLLFES